MDLYGSLIYLYGCGNLSTCFSVDRLLFHHKCSWYDSELPAPIFTFFCRFFAAHKIALQSEAMNVEQNLGQAMTNHFISSRRSFILRVRNDEPDGEKQPRWRFVLLDSECGYRRCFTSLDQLFTTLYMEISGDKSPEVTNTEIICAVEEMLGSVSSYAAD